MRIEEYDDGYDSRISFERADEDRPEDCERPDGPPPLLLMADPVRDAAHDLLAALRQIEAATVEGGTVNTIARTAIARATRGQHRPEDRPAPTFVSARESAIDEQAALYDDPHDGEDC